ncbi:MAG: c-type cytochrome [Bacteroidetes bacterium]|nr:c-type cytochrome [Bacteroidota bacterium]
MQKQEEDYQRNVGNTISKLINLIILLLFIIALLIFLLCKYMPDYCPAPEKITKEKNTDPAKTEIKKETISFWKSPDTSTIPANDKELILYGKELISKTSSFFGTNGSIKKMATNGMNCQNCHLDAGTKIFGNNYSAVYSTYPKYRARSGTNENIYKRINDCFERSLNGVALDTNSKEMKAIVAYIHWLGKDVAKGKKPEGAGLKDISFLDRAADPKKGEAVYTQKCLSCHQKDGSGQLNNDQVTFLYPPLWGKNSYNDGAGLYRLSNFAKFVKYNMPLGAAHDAPQLTDEEAWDVAAYVNSQPRPKKDTSKDWPKTKEKPFDHPFGPYADGFSEAEHKYGPYQIIKDKIAQLNDVKK